LCTRRFRGQASFTAHSGKTFADKPFLEAPACASASAAPRASIKLSRVRTGSPVLKLRVKRAGGGAKLRRLKLTLPHGLRAVPPMSRKGVLVKSAGKLGRSHWKLTRGAITVRKLPAPGVASLRLVLQNGTLRSSPALRAGKRGKLSFKLRLSDAAGHSFKLKRRVRP